MKKIFLLAAWLFLPLAVLAQGQPIKVGVLMPYTGVFAVVGQDATKGFELYLEKVGYKAGGREIQVIKEDEETKPDVGLTKTKKLVERDRVDVLVGPVTVGVAIAMRDYVHAAGIPLIITTPGVPSLTAPPMASPWIFRVTETHDMSNYSLGTWVAKKTKHRRMVVIASDFVAGRHSAAAFMSAFKSAGGEVVREIYVPVNTADFASAPCWPTRRTAASSRSTRPRVRGQVQGGAHALQRAGIRSRAAHRYCGQRAEGRRRQPRQTA